MLFVINHLRRGGAETQLLGVVGAAVEAGHDVRIATLLAGNDFEDRVSALGVEVLSPREDSGSWSLRHLWWLARRAREWRPDVTVAFLLQATLFTRALNIWVRPSRKVSSMRNERLESALRSLFYRWTCRADDCVVANSASAAARLRESKTVPVSTPLTVVYNGLDARALREQNTVSRDHVRETLGVPESAILFLGVGRLSSQKNWALLARALASVPDDDRVAVVAGTGELEADLRTLAEELGVGRRLSFVGLRNDVADLMIAADCLVLTSDYEGTPNVVLEAMALGLSVIATDVGACRELLTRPDDVIVPPGDEQAFATALSTFSPGTRHEEQELDQRFDWSTIGAEWMQIIARGVSRGSASLGG